jgi:hypothetical protein
VVIYGPVAYENARTTVLVQHSKQNLDFGRGEDRFKCKGERSQDPLYVSVIQKRGTALLEIRQGSGEMAGVVLKQGRYGPISSDPNLFTAPRDRRSSVAQKTLSGPASTPFTCERPNLRNREAS